MGRHLLAAGTDGVFSSLGHPQYRALWTATLLSTVANWTVLTGRGWVAYDLHNHSSTVGLVMFASMLPFLLVTPFGGVLADRFDRRRLLLLSLAVSLLSAVGLVALALHGSQAPHDELLLVLLSFVNGAARSIEVPAGQSMVPGMVPERELLNAVALGGLATHGSRLIGPLAAAPLLDHGGAAGAFALAAGMYLFAMIAVIRLRPVRRIRADTTSPIAQLAEGVRYVLHDRVVLLIIALVFFHCGLSMHYDAVLPVMSREVLGAGGTSYSSLIMMIGAGSLVGTFALAALPTGFHRGLLLFGAGVLSGGTLILLAFATNWPAALAGAALVGGSQAVFMALTNTILQLATPDAVRGRVLSIYLMVGGGVMAFANLATGGLADRYGVTPVLAIPAALFIIIVALSTLGPSLRGVYGRRTAPAAVH